jgi:membrane-associated phospholipid phosphatase
LKDIISEIFLRFSSPIVILLLIFVFSLLLCSEKKHRQAFIGNKDSLTTSRAFIVQIFCLLCFTIILNYALKITCKIPLDISLHKKGYAFPSGHMNLSTTFYFWLFLHLSSRYWRTCILLLLIGIGWGLIHYHYHNLRDVIGGCLLGSLVAIFYIKSLRIFATYIPWLLLSAATFLVLYIYLVQFEIIDYVQFYYSMLAIIILFERLTSLNGKRFNVWRVCFVIDDYGSFRVRD